MLKKKGGYAAAKEYAERHGELDEFEEDSMAYQLDLMKRGRVGEREDGDGWFVTQEDDWWLVASARRRGQRPAGLTEVRAGPFPTKRAAMKDAGISRTHRAARDGVYLADRRPGEVYWIVRHAEAVELELVP